MIKRLVIFTAGFSLAATAAFGQFAPPPPQLGMNVVYRDTGNSEQESRALAEMITRTLDKSRYLHLVPVLDDESMELEAPRELVKDAASTRVTVRYEVTPPRGTGREFTANCTSTHLQRCADLIVQRLERLAREAQLDREAGRQPN